MPVLSNGQTILTDRCERIGKVARCLTVAAAAADRRKPVPPSMLRFVDRAIVTS